MDAQGLLPVLLLVVAALGLIPAEIARRRGYSFVGFWIFGTFFFLIALAVALVLEPRTPSRPTPIIRRCPSCREPIGELVETCPYCRHRVGGIGLGGGESGTNDPMPEQSANPIATIEQLDRLRRSGILSEVEFAQKKAELLRQI